VATQPDKDKPAQASYAAVTHWSKPGVDFKVDYKSGGRAFLIAAPHGGNIEAGSSELAQSVAGTIYGYYCFEGLKKDSSDLYMPSTRFDEPELVRVTKNYTSVVSLHVIAGAERMIYVGGRNKSVVDGTVKALTEAKFQVMATPPSGSAWEGANLVNRTGAGGVQIELTSALVDDMFRGPVANIRIRSDATRRTPDFDRFVAAVRNVLTRSGDARAGLAIHIPDKPAAPAAVIAPPPATSTTTNSSGSQGGGRHRGWGGRGHRSGGDQGGY
jgi:phage replication-related protein YjqB (UPF0714/DUF867 family)